MAKLVCISLATMSPAEIPKETVICLGNFDGVHLAHRALLRTACIQKSTAMPHAASCVFTFYQPSWVAFSKDEHPLLLSTLEERLTAFRNVGIEYAVLCDFGEIREYIPEDFVQKILLEQCHCRAAVCGFNYRFGKKGAGTPALLQNLLGYPVTVQSEVVCNKKTVSSTEIRTLITEGRVKEAAKLLDEPYALTGEIVHGKALGKKLGFPTLNQSIPENKLMPKNGVYLTRCQIDGEEYFGVTNVGHRPTVKDGMARNCETHLLDVDRDFYGKTATVSFLEFLRPEKKFDSVEALCNQMQSDVATARLFLA